MPSADHHRPVGFPCGLHTASARTVSVFPCGLMERCARRPSHAGGFGKPVPPFSPALFSQSRWFSRGPPVCCFLRVTVRCTWMRRGNWRTSDCVAPSSPCSMPHTCRRGLPPAVACPSAHAFVSGFLKAALRTVPLPYRLPFGVTYLGLDLLVDRTSPNSYA